MEYIYQIIGVVILATVLKFYVPDGEIKPLINWVVSIIITLVIVSPIFTLFINNKNFNEMFSDVEATLQQDFIDYSYEKTKENDIVIFKKNAESFGVKNIKVNAYYSVNNFTIKYKKVQIDLKNAVIIGDKSHIDIVNELTSFAKNIFGSEVKVEFV